MTALIEVRVADLIGPALDWAVAKALGWQMIRVPKDVDGNFGGEVLAPHDLSADFKFPQRGQVPSGFFLRRWSTDWSHGGPLIEKHRISFEDEDDCFSALLALERPVVSVGSAFGTTHLIAACRAIVAAKLGETVTVPAELVQAVQS